MPQDFLPSDDTGQLRGNIQTAVGTSFNQNIKYVKQVVNIVEKAHRMARNHCLSTKAHMQLATSHQLSGV